MISPRLLNLKERYDAGLLKAEDCAPIDSPVEYVTKARVIKGHADKQRPCHCGYDQSCTTLVCATCRTRHGANDLSVIERDEHGLVTTFYYKPCRCGAKDWLYGCEAFDIRRYE